MSVMRDNKDLQAVWQGQSIRPVEMTAEQLRARATKFQSRIRWRNAREYVAAAILVPWLGLSFVHFHDTLVRLGAAMTMLWVLYLVYSLHRYGSTHSLPSVSEAQSCAAFHRQELQRQRDLARAWPWGIAPAIPGLILLPVGLAVESKRPDAWEVAIGIIGIFAFLIIAMAIYNKRTADRLQREIDSLVVDLDEPPRAD